MRAALAFSARARRRVDGFTLLLAALAALGAGLVLAREVTYGIAVGWDTVVYISTARNLLEGQWFIQFNDWPYLHWPPLYPLLLAALSFGVFDPYTVAGPLNAVIFGLTIFAAGCCLRRWVRNRLLLVWGGVAAALSIPLATVAFLALSEPLFILFITLSLLHSVRYFESGRRTALLWAAVFAALAFLTRYTGITLILTMAPLLLLQRGVALPEKARRLSWYLAIAVLPQVLWLLRNYLTYGEIRAAQTLGPHGWPEVLRQYLSDLAGWLLLYQPASEWGAAAALTAACVVGLAAAVFLGLAAAIARLKDDAGANRRRWIGCGVFGGFGLVYLAFLGVIQSFLVRTEPLGDRHIVSAYIPLLLAAALALDGLLAGGQRKSGLQAVAVQLFNRTSILKWGGVKPTLLLVAAAGFAIWSGYGLLLHARVIDVANAYGYGTRYDPYWIHNETLRYAEQHLAEETRFTNGNMFLYLYLETNLGNNRSVPHELNDTEDELAELAGDAYLIWPATFNTAYNTADLLLMPGLEVAAELSDGFIFHYPRTEGGDTRPPTSAWSDGLVAGGPAARAGGFDLYLTEHRLLYVKESCADGDLAGWFYLNIYPMDAADVPAWRQGANHDVWGFEFGDYGAVRDGRCLAAFPLPDYAIARLEVGQRNPPENWQSPLWQAAFPAYTAGRVADWQAYYAQLTAGEPTARANGFEVYLGDSELVYAKAPCTAADTAAPFFRYIVPRDAADFPEWLREQGYDWREFGFAEYGAAFDGKCLAVLPFTTLPGYRLARIVAGQHTPGVGALWEVDFPAINGGTAGHWRRWHKRLTNGAPAASSDFDVYLGEGELLYAKAPCAAADVEATFFLHLIPQNLADLPEWRRGHDFDNLDFKFGPNGAVFDGRCLAAVPLPEYAISRIRTGQYVPDSGAVWEVEFAVGE